MKILIILLSLQLFTPLYAQTSSSSGKKVTTKKSYKKSKRLKKKSKSKRKKRYVRRKKPAKKSESTLVKMPLKFLESTRHFISSGWVGFNHDLDMFFSGQRYNQSQNKSKILLSYTIQKKESEEMVKAFDFGIKVHLPKLSKKLSIVIEKQRDEIIEAQSAQPVQTVNVPERGYTAGVKYLLKKTPFFTTSLDTGLRLRLPLDAFIKLKAFKFSEFKFVNIYFGQKLIYYRQEADLRSITEFNFSKQINSKLALTQANALTWTDNSDQFALRNSLSLSQIIDDKNAMAYTIGANALLSPTYYYSSYDAFITYRRKLYQDWFSGSLSGGALFDKSKDFKQQNFVALRLDVLMN